MKRITLDNAIAASRHTQVAIPLITIPCMWWGSIIGDQVTGKHTPIGWWIAASVGLALLLAFIVLRIMFYSRRKLALKKIGLLVQVVNNTRGPMERCAQQRLNEQCIAFEKVFGFCPIELIAK